MREKRTSVKKCAANRAIQEAKTMIRAKNFKSAVTKVEEAISLYTHLPYGQEMLTICEFLHKSETFKPQPDRETWPYDLLQIPTSSTESQVVTRYDELTRYLVLAKNNTSRFLSKSRAKLALEFLHQTMSVYSRNNLVLSDVDTDDDDECEDAGDDDDDGGDSVASEEEENSDDDPAEPRVLPFSRYCPSIKREIRLVFDVIYLRLIGKLQNSDDVNNLSDEEENTIQGELSNLEEMGYDVVKLKERFILLMRVKLLGMLDQSKGEMREELKVKLSTEKVPRRIARFKRYDEEIKVQHYDLKLELVRVKSLLRTTKEELCCM